jgi:hypothetical protein
MYDRELALWRIETMDSLFLLWGTGTGMNTHPSFAKKVSRDQ